jgi:hypothetical protein
VGVGEERRNMSDQVSMVWVLRNRRTRKTLQWVAPLARDEPTIFIWTDKHSAHEFLKLLDREDGYEACFVPLDVVVARSKHIRVNPDLRPDSVEYARRDIDLMQEDVP